MEILTTSGSLGWDPGPFLGDMAVDHQGNFFHKAMKGGDSETSTRIWLGHGSFRSDIFHQDSLHIFTASRITGDKKLISTRGTSPNEKQIWHQDGYFSHMISRCWETIHFFLGFQIRKLEPSYANGGSSRRFFFLLGCFCLPFCKRTRSKRKTTNFPISNNLPISPSWAGPWKLKSPFNNILPSSTTFTGCANQTASFFFSAHIHGISVWNHWWWTDRLMLLRTCFKRTPSSSCSVICSTRTADLLVKNGGWWLVALDRLMSFGWHVFWEEPKPLKGPFFKRTFLQLPTNWCRIFIP